MGETWTSALTVCMLGVLYGVRCLLSLTIVLSITDGLNRMVWRMESKRELSLYRNVRH